MDNYIPPEKRTVEQIRADLDKAFARWDQINKDGCNDPFWSDGVNMNLVRNHIISHYRLLSKKLENVQLSLFDTGMDMTNERPVPPLVPADYMSPTGEYPDRLTKRVQ